MVFELERLGWIKKQWLFLIIVLLSALYIFEFTTTLVSFFVEYRLDEPFSFIAVKNILGVFLFILFVLFYLNQIDYKHIALIGWDLTYYLFITAILIGGAYLFEPTYEIVRYLVDWKLDIFPLISIKNIIGLILFVISFKIWKTTRS